MRILLTGSSGWLGRFLAPRLRESGHDVVGLDVASGVHTNVLASVEDRDCVERLFTSERFEAVIHAGALHKPDLDRYPESAFVAVNVDGTRNLLDAAIEAGCRAFIFTSTTSLMVSETVRAGRAGGATRAFWLDEDFPAEPRNIYGTTKLAAERLCAERSRASGLPIIVLRTGRYFPEEDDTHRDLSGPNRKANEFLGRRLTVEDAADAHLAALERAPAISFQRFIIAAPTPFLVRDTELLIQNAPAVIGHHFPTAASLYRRAEWTLPAYIDRIYDSRRAERGLGFRCRTDFNAILRALESGAPLPFAHDPSYVSPVLTAERGRS